MTDNDRPTDEERGDDEMAPEVPTTFATKGVGWSGREKDDLDITESDTPPRPHTFRRSRPAGGE
ncbi:MAG: hypothetical protein QOJ69_1595 [Actinomycetota bacterium]|jgi:hypothetical protein|nr:hypothetical protein [Actinomycetota bacterium]MEA2843924.1 hypothetical protein [Actinomycetota bacterium]